jgi:hypothetical protein
VRVVFVFVAGGHLGVSDARNGVLFVICSIRCGVECFVSASNGDVPL